MASEHDQGQSGLHQYPPFDAARARLESLPRKQHRLARALLDEPELIAFGSIRDVAAKVEVNAATVMRFAQLLGYSGYQDLQSAVRQAYLQYAGLQPPLEQRLLKHADRVIGELHAHQRFELDRLYERLDEHRLQALCDTLDGARRVFVCGEGAASTPAALLVRMLHYVGIRAEYLPSGGVDSAVAMYGLGEEDVVVGVALWLPFHTTVLMLRRAREAGSRTIVFASSPEGPVAREATHVVIAPGQGIALPFSVLPTVALIETVAAMLAGRRPEVVAEMQRVLRNRYVDEGLVAHDRS